MSFLDYAGTPFEPFILPIIPKGAGDKLSPHSKLTPDRLGKIPGVKYREGWGGFPKHIPWSTHIAKAGTLAAWARMYQEDGLVETIGVQARILIAIDVDFDDPNYARIIEEFAVETLGPAPARMRSNSGKVLLCYRLKQEPGARPVTKQRALYRTMFGDQGAVEVLGAGQQWLIEGMHPSGVPYEWRMGVSPLVLGFEGLTEVSADQVEIFMGALNNLLTSSTYSLTRVKGGGNARLGGFNDTPAAEVGPNHPDLCPDLAMLEDVLTNYLPCTLPEFSTYDEWAAACVAIVTACGKDEEFYDTFYEWCAAVPENLTDGDDYIRGKWESVNESKIGWTYLCAIAHDYGYSGDAQRTFEQLHDLPITPETPALPTPRLDASYEGVIADRFVAKHAQKDWIFAPRKNAGDWLRFENGVWHEDTTVLHDVSLQCQEVGNRIRSNNAATPAHMAVAKQMFTDRAARAVRSLVQNHPAIVVPYSELDNQPLILGVPGGYIDREGRLREPDPKLFLTTQTNVAPDFNARCPQFDELLMHLANGDPELHDCLWELLGYTLTGLCSEQIFIFLLGKRGGEGKTTLTTTMQLVLGDYATPIRNSTFVRSQNTSDIRFALSALKGKRFAYANEIELGQRWAGERLKEVTGGGYITVERKYSGLERMRVQSTIWIVGNSLPYFPPADSAVQRRMVLMEAKTPIAKNVDQPGFAEYLAKTEGAAILARMVEASQRYIRRGRLLIPESVRRDVENRFFEDDLILQFVEECCELGPDCAVSGHTLFQTYNHWAKCTAEVQHTLGRNTFLRLIEDHPHLKKLGHEIVRTRHVDSSDASSPRGLKGIGVSGQVTNLTALSR